MNAEAVLLLCFLISYSIASNTYMIADGTTEIKLSKNSKNILHLPGFDFVAQPIAESGKYTTFYEVAICAPKGLSLELKHSQWSADRFYSTHTQTEHCSNTTHELTLFVAPIPSKAYMIVTCFDILSVNSLKLSVIASISGSFDNPFPITDRLSFPLHLYESKESCSKNTPFFRFNDANVRHSVYVSFSGDSNLKTDRIRVTLAQKQSVCMRDNDVLQRYDANCDCFKYSFEENSIFQFTSIFHGKIISLPRTNEYCPQNFTLGFYDDEEEFEFVSAYVNETTVLFMLIFAMVTILLTIIAIVIRCKKKQRKNEANYAVMGSFVPEEYSPLI